MQRISADKQSSIAVGTASRRQKKILSKLREIYLKSVCFAAMKVDGYINEAAVVSRLPEWEDEQSIIKAALQTFNKEASEWIEQEGNVAKLLALTLEAWLIIIELRNLFNTLKSASEKKEARSLEEQVKHFLANRWQRICSTDFAYTHSPDDDSRYFSYSLFKELAELIAPVFKTTAVELLIPTLRMKKNIYGISVSELDLRRCELDEKDESLIDVAACLEAAGPEGKYYLQIEGPVQPELTPDVRKRVTEHSKEAKECHAAIEAVLECKRKGASLGSQIFRLQERLLQGGVHGGRGGEETKAGGDAYNGVKDFHQFLKGLSEEHRTTIFKLTSASLTVAPNFKIIWYRLLIRAVLDKKISLPEAEQREILEELERHPTTQFPCSELIAGNIEVILNDNKNIFNIFSGESEAVQEAVGVLDYRREEKQQALFAAMAKPSYQVTATYGEDATKIFLRRLLVNQELLDMALKVSWNLDEFILILTSLDIARVDDYLNKLNDGFFLGLFENRNYLIKIFNALVEWPDPLQEKFLTRVGMLCSLSVTDVDQLLDILDSLQDNVKMKFLCCFSRLSLKNIINDGREQGHKSLACLLAKLPPANHHAFFTLLGDDQLIKLIENISQLQFVLSRLSPTDWVSFLNYLGRERVIRLFYNRVNSLATRSDQHLGAVISESKLIENRILIDYLGEDLKQIARTAAQLRILLALVDHAAAEIILPYLGVDHVARLVPNFVALMELLKSLDRNRRAPTLILFGADYFLLNIIKNSQQLKHILYLLHSAEQNKAIYKLLGELQLARILQAEPRLESPREQFELFLEVLDSISVERRMEFLALFQHDYLRNIIRDYAMLRIVLNRLPSRHELNFIKHIGDNHVRRVITDGHELVQLLSELNNGSAWQRVFQIVDVDPTRPNSIINDVTELHQALAGLTVKANRIHFLESLGEDVTNSLLLKENYTVTLRKIEACPNADVRNQLYLALTRAYRSQRRLQGDYKTCWGRFFSCVGKGYHKNAKLDAARTFEDAIARGEDILAVGALNDGDLGKIVKSYRLSRRQSR